MIFLLIIGVSILSFQVHQFFKQRIEMQYPLADDNLDPYEQVREQHESFMKSRCEKVFGRREFTQKVTL